MHPVTALCARISPHSTSGVRKLAICRDQVFKQHASPDDQAGFPGHGRKCGKHIYLVERTDIYQHVLLALER